MQKHKRAQLAISYDHLPLHALNSVPVSWSSFKPDNCTSAVSQNSYLFYKTSQNDGIHWFHKEFWDLHGQMFVTQVTFWTICKVNLNYKVFISNVKQVSITPGNFLQFPYPFPVSPQSKSPSSQISGISWPPLLEYSCSRNASVCYMSTQCCRILPIILWTNNSWGLLYFVSRFPQKSTSWPMGAQPGSAVTLSSYKYLNSYVICVMLAKC